MKNTIKEIFLWNKIAGNKAWELDYHLERDMNYEEDFEFMQAVKNGDRKEMLDWWCDKIFVSTGTMMKAWFTEEELLAGISEVISSNFSKFFKDENWELKCIKNEAGKIQKPESFRKPDFNFLEK